MTGEQIYSVLFLSQRSAARSVMAAALLNVIGSGRFRAFSAGVRPAAQFDPVALELLDHAKVPAPAGTPQHYQEFARADAPNLDFVFTLSDTAAGEPPPVWPGMPVTAHWRCTDAEKFGDDAAAKRLALIDTRAQLERRLRVFVNLPFTSLDRLSMQTHVDQIGNDRQTTGLSSITGQHSAFALEHHCEVASANSATNAVSPYAKPFATRK